MLWWIADNVTMVVVLLGMVAFVLGAVWWHTRKTKWLIGTVVTIGLMVVAVVISQLVVTDRQQLALNVESMREAINAGKLDEALAYFDDEVTVVYSGGEPKLKKSEIKSLAKKNMAHYAVHKVLTGSVHVDELARPKAEMHFNIGNEEGDKRGVCRMKCLLGSDGKWRIHWLTVEAPIGGAKTPVLLPF